MKRERRKFSASFKTKVVLEALKERETIQQLAAKFELHPNQISQWKSDFLANADQVLTRTVKRIKLRTRLKRMCFMAR